MSGGAILITGSDGYVGLRLLRECLASTDAPVLAWVRALSEEELARKREKIVAQVGSHPRLQVVGGELDSDEPFSSVTPSEVEAIVHSASVTRFNVEAELAEKVNFQGSRKLFAFARRCPNLKRVLYLSTVYASGLRADAIPEEVLDDVGFANHYESSKWRSEMALVSEFSDLPWVIARIATVIADGDSGVVTQYNVVHNTLKLLYYGLISLVPGREEVPLYFVTGDFVTQTLRSLLSDSAGLRRIYHVVHRREETLTLGRLLDIVFEVFNEDPAFAARRVLRPLLVDQSTFDIMASQMGKFSGGVVQQALGSIEPFAKQLFIEKSFQNDRLRNALPSYAAPDPLELARSTARSLVATKWGRK